MNFSYNETCDYLELTAYKADVKIFFQNGGVWYIDLNGHEFDPKDELDGIFVQVRVPKTFIPPTMHSLQEILSEAENQYDGIAEETRRESHELAGMARELSSPQYTGRI